MNSIKRLTKKSVKRVTALSLALLSLPRPVAAIGQCSFDSVTGVNFGSYDVFNTTTLTPPAPLPIPASP